MAPSAPNTGPLVLRSRDVTRIVVVLLGISILIAAFATPWWTRGLTTDDAASGNAFFSLPGAEGNYYDYGPFKTPSSVAGDSVDSGRAAAVAVLGVLAVVATLFMAAHLVLRYLAFMGRVQVDAAVPVRLAIAAALVGMATILWAGLFLPLAGPNPGFLYGEEPGFEGAPSDLPFEVGRYANAGFFFGIVAFIALPIYLWVDAAASRVRMDDPLLEGKAAPRDVVSF